MGALNVANRTLAVMDNYFFLRSLNNECVESIAVGEGDGLYNLALLHRTCNGIKWNRLTLEELRRYNADNGCCT